MVTNIGDAPDFARGEGNMETSSEEEEDEDETNEAEPSTSKEGKLSFDYYLDLKKINI